MLELRIHIIIVCVPHLKSVGEDSREHAVDFHEHERLQGKGGLVGQGTRTEGQPPETVRASVAVISSLSS